MQKFTYTNKFNLRASNLNWTHYVIPFPFHGLGLALLWKTVVVCLQSLGFNSTDMISCVSRAARPQTNKTETPEQCGVLVVSTVASQQESSGFNFWSWSFQCGIWMDFLHVPCHGTKTSQVKWFGEGKLSTRTVQVCVCLFVLAQW